MIDENLLATYSLLSYIRENRHGDKEKSLLGVFIPIVSEGLYEMLRNNRGAQVKGKDYTEIKEAIEKVFSLEIPVRILEQILPDISTEDKNLILYGDHSFIINSKFNSSLTSQYGKEKDAIESLFIDYQNYCKALGEKSTPNELVDFIQDQKSRIFDDKESIIGGQNYYVSKYVYQKIKRKDIFFNIICNIYLCGVIASYLKFQIHEKVVDTELLVDTNFYISLLDLNTEEAYETCKQLFNITASMGFRYSILETTIEQIRILLSNRSKRYKDKDLFARIDIADVLSACDRRGLSQSDLDAYKDNILNDLGERGINIIYSANIRSLIQKTSKSKDLQTLTKLRHNEQSAFNDLLAQEYVSSKRAGKSIAEFSDVNCWFLNNSYSTNKTEVNKPIWQRFSITASDLLVLLWFANPSLKVGSDSKILAATSLSANVFQYRSEKYPTYKVIQRMQEKIIQLQTSNLISQKVIANLCIRMSEGCIDGNEAERLITLKTDDFLQYVDQFKEQDQSIQNAIKEKDELVEQNKKLMDGNTELKINSEISNMRLCGVVYLLIVLGIYFFYRFVIQKPLANYSNVLDNIVQFTYWILTTIVVNFINHWYCIKGLLSFVIPKRIKRALASQFSK
jgi:hypothetical protein